MEEDGDHAMLRPEREKGGGKCVGGGRWAVGTEAAARNGWAAVQRAYKVCAGIEALANGNLGYPVACWSLRYHWQGPCR